MKSNYNGSQLKREYIATVFLLTYLVTVLWYTVLKRSPALHDIQPELFWSYRKWFAGGSKFGTEIMANIAMFIPFGFLLSAILPNQLKHRKAMVFVSATAFSLLIESLQLFLARGLFEVDDLISNSVGSLLGAGLYNVLWKRMNEKIFSIVFLTAGVMFMGVCYGVTYRGWGSVGGESDNSPRKFCFQIDKAVLDGDMLTVQGFVFQYEKPEDKLALFLRKTENGDNIDLTLFWGVLRPDVNDYFLCEHDYSETGFEAVGKVDPSAEYEILVKWSGVIMISTGVYITGENIHYASADSFIPPSCEDAEDLAEIVKNGVVRVYRPDYHCWVYQMGWDLYWIVDPDFYFEEDGTTYIQYHLHTTQTDNLPEKRLANGHLWDNIGGHFEEYELQGEFGSYRVMKREIPTAYSVTSIVTGYYKDKKWIWKNYFRPFYDFGIGKFEIF